jgi:hypothetical protein
VDDAAIVVGLDVGSWMIQGTLAAPPTAIWASQPENAIFGKIAGYDESTGFDRYSGTIGVVERKKALRSARIPLPGCCQQDSGATRRQANHL